MRAIDRKLLRDLFSMKGQSIAIALVIGAGVATFVMSLHTLAALTLSRETYYDRYRFADVFAHLKRAPMSLEKRIAQIPGVAAVQTRVVVDVTLDVPGLREPATGRIVSVPSSGRPVLNDLYLRSGRWLEPGRPDEVLVSEAFSEANNLQVGDRISAVINGSLQKLRVVGIALSPEYVLQIKGGEAMPADKRFGVFWMAQDQLAPAFDLDGAFNDITLRLVNGANEAKVISELDQLTESYGGVGAYGRADQLSNQFLSNEIRGLRGMGLIAPIIFLSVATFLLNVVLTRIIATQREQIAALKAFGYQSWQVALHYFKFVLIITTIGVVGGTLMGVWLGHGLGHMYAVFYKFPIYEYHFRPPIAAQAAGIGLLAAGVGAWGAVRRAVKLPPAEAMRPEPPSRYKPTILEQLGLQRFLSQPARMVLRQLERRPFKTLLSTIGIATAVAVLVLGAFMQDALDALVEHSYFTVQTQDVNIGFVEPVAETTIYEVSRLPGVLYAEPVSSVSVRMTHGQRSKRLGIMALPVPSNLYRMIDTDAHPHEIPTSGLLVSDMLAKVLDANVGDIVTVEILQGRRQIKQVPIAGIITDFSGTNAYMRASELHKLLEEEHTINSALLKVDASRLDDLYRTLKQTPKVDSVSVRAAVLQSFNQTVGENQKMMRIFNTLFACVIACGVVYNTARISLSERSRELATLRVIGMTRAEISSILLGELATLTLAAIPLGFLLGWAFSAAAVAAFNSELFRIPLVISHKTLGFASVVTLLASIASGFIVRRRLDRLDLVAVLKSKE